MSIQIILDREQPCFTNYDTVSGRVRVRLTQPTTISIISVKLEGESTSTLSAFREDGRRKDKKNIECEVHKVLYHVQTVFPDIEVMRRAMPGSTWTLPTGMYEYPFSFSLPYDSDCIKNTMGHANNLGDLLLDNNRDMYNNVHVKTKLPPSLGGLPGRADIIYYLKATLVRPQFYKENFRSLSRLTFVPIEPPRPPLSKEEAFARRQYSFGTNVTRTRSMFSRSLSKRALDNDYHSDEPSFSVDARLPNPAILTCNQPIPLRIVLKKLNDSRGQLYLQSIEIDLIGYTHIRARYLRKMETGSWVIRTSSNMNRLLAGGDVTAGTEWDLDPSLWDTVPLPPTVAPTFTTCNISRNYEIEVRLGFANGRTGSKTVQSVVLPLRLQCEVFSGIVPPPHMLGSSPPPPLPIKNTGPPQGPPPQPPRPTNPPPIPQQEEDEAPPTYEAAVADALVEAQNDPGPSNVQSGPPSGPPPSQRHVSDQKIPPAPAESTPSPTPRPSTSQTHEYIAPPPPGPPPGRSDRSVSMPSMGQNGLARQDSLLDAPTEQPAHPTLTPQATSNNPFANYMTGEHPQGQGGPSHQQTPQLQGQANDALAAFSPPQGPPTANLLDAQDTGATTRSNNPFAEYLPQQESNQPQNYGSGQNNHTNYEVPLPPDISNQIDEDRRLAEQLQQMELAEQQGGTTALPDGENRPSLPPRPTGPTTGAPAPAPAPSQDLLSFDQVSGAPPMPPRPASTNPAAASPSPFGPPPGIPPRPSSVNPAGEYQGQPYQGQYQQPWYEQQPHQQQQHQQQQHPY